MLASCTAPRSATVCAWPTPTCGSRSSKTSAAAATRPCSAAARRSASRCGQATTTRAEGAPDLVITNARRARPLGRRQVRRRRPRRAHRRARQGRQPRHDGRRGSPRWRSVRARRSSRARAASSPRAASTATCTSSARRSSTRRSRPAMTTLIGGGTGPAEGTKATTCTPGASRAGGDAGGDRRSAR